MIPRDGPVWFGPIVWWAAFAAAAALIGACILLLCVSLAMVVLRARSKRAEDAASTRVRPVLHAALVDFLAGAGDETVFRPHLEHHRADLAESILLFQGTVAGSARDRLCQLALDLELVKEWCADARTGDVVRRRAAVSHLSFACSHEPSRRVAGGVLTGALQDADEEVRLSACRGLVHAGDAGDIERVFDFALRQNLMTRVVLTEDLRRHGQSLTAGPVRQALRSTEVGTVRAALEILVAWERAIALDDLREFLEFRDTEVRILAFRLAAFVTIDFESRLALLRSLNDGDSQIRGLAIIAIGRQKMTDAIPELAHCMRREGIDLARHAAEALAAMPPLGWRALEDFVAGGDPVTALAAGQALAQARKGA